MSTPTAPRAGLPPFVVLVDGWDGDPVSFWPHYLSTACQHGEHKTCRKVCKFCPEKCRCACHAEVPCPTFADFSTGAGEPSDPCPTCGGRRVVSPEVVGEFGAEHPTAQPASPVDEYEAIRLALRSQKRGKWMELAVAAALARRTPTRYPTRKE